MRTACHRFCERGCGRLKKTKKKERRDKTKATRTDTNNTISNSQKKIKKPNVRGCFGHDNQSIDTQACRMIAHGLCMVTRTAANHTCPRPKVEVHHARTFFTQSTDRTPQRQASHVDKRHIFDHPSLKNSCTLVTRTFCFFCRTELKNFVEGTTFLVRPGHRHVFFFDPYLTAGHVRKGL
jgi:hypothetical protein